MGFFQGTRRHHATRSSEHIGGSLYCDFEQFRTHAVARYPWSRVKSIMSEMSEADVVVVVPSGNFAEHTHRHDTDVDTFSVLWESSNFPLIAARAVNDQDHLAPFSQGPGLVTVWAPGVDVSCATHGTGSNSGTRFSTGLVSWLSLMTYRVSLTLTACRWLFW